jgi:hypothetical protein
MTLHRFWFKFSSAEPYDPVGLGCGVTAHDYSDALSILQETVFAGQELPCIESVVKDVELSALDQKHVVPNMEPAIWRGVWFPKGYLHLWPGSK